MNKGVNTLKISYKVKILLLCLSIISTVVVGMTLFSLKSENSNMKSFKQISEGLSKNLNQIRNTPGITMTGLAADPSKKLFKIGIEIDTKIISSEQLKEAVDSYLVNTASFTVEDNWKSILKPYNLRIEELHSGELLAEKPSGSDEITWSSLKKRSLG